MARIRTVKPELFRHEDLFELEHETGLPVRLAFIGMFTVADREGRFKWRPRELKLDVLPYDNVDFSRVLDALSTRGFIEKYSVDGVDYGIIPTFIDHQVINNRESQSNLPPKPEKSEDPENPPPPTRQPRVNDASTSRHDLAQGEGKGREGNMEGEEERVVDDASQKRKNSELDFSSWPELPSKQVMADWQSTRKKKRAVISQTVIDEFGKELHRAHNAGFSVDQCLIACVVHNWQGFKLEWLQNKLGVSPHLPNLRAPPKTRDISLEQQLNDRSWANATPVQCEVVRE